MLVEKMFDTISPTYDRTNRILSLGLDQYWRRQVAKFLPPKKNLFLLDCATGTGDEIIALMEHAKSVSQAIGIDLATEMLRLGRQKMKVKPYKNKVLLQQGSATALQFSADMFDCATISFGIRNVDDVPRCLREIHRVLKPGGRIVVLEFSLPKNELMKALHLFYLRRCLPYIGGWLSKNRDAYTYLNKTIEAFPSGRNFCNLMDTVGFTATAAHPLTGGIVTLYVGDKPCSPG